MEAWQNAKIDKKNFTTTKQIFGLAWVLLLENKSITLNAKMAEIKTEANDEPNLLRGKAKVKGCYRNRDEIKSV